MTGDGVTSLGSYRPRGAKRKWKVGEEWGRLRVTERWREPEERDGVRDSHGPLVIELECQCGERLAIREEEFNQKRDGVRSCGAEECEELVRQDLERIGRGSRGGGGGRKTKTGKQEGGEVKVKRGRGRPVSEAGRGMPVQLWLPMRLIGDVDKWAEGQGLSRSAAVRVLVERAMADYRTE